MASQNAFGRGPFLFMFDLGPEFALSLLRRLLAFGVISLFSVWVLLSFGRLVEKGGSYQTGHHDVSFCYWGLHC